MNIVGASPPVEAHLLSKVVSWYKTGSDIIVPPFNVKPRLPREIKNRKIIQTLE